MVVVLEVNLLEIIEIQGFLKDFGVPESFRQTSGKLRQLSAQFRRVPEQFGQTAEKLRLVPEGFGQLPETFGRVPEEFRQLPEKVRFVPEKRGELPEEFRRTAKESRRGAVAKIFPKIFMRDYGMI